MEERYKLRSSAYAYIMMLFIPIAVRPEDPCETMSNLLVSESFAMLVQADDS